MEETSRHQRFLERRRTRLERDGRRRLEAIALGVALGIAIWSGVQATTGLDNFGNYVDPIYFALFFATAFGLGWLLESFPVLASFAMCVSQLPAYVVYPNTHWELGNLFPIAAAMLFVLTLPAVLLAYAGTKLRARWPRAKPK